MYKYYLPFLFIISQTNFTSDGIFLHSSVWKNTFLIDHHHLEKYYDIIKLQNKL